MSLKQEIAPNGVLRFAINVGNSVLTEYDTQTGKVGGITVEIARDLAHKLDLPLELKIYRSARTVVQDASKDIWDIGFIARDPKRSAQITFTSPYILIEGCYLVRWHSSAVSRLCNTERSCSPPARIFHVHRTGHSHPGSQHICSGMLAGPCSWDHSNGLRQVAH